MFLTHITKYRKVEGGHSKELFEGSRYYRLSESYRNKDGKSRNRVVLTLGYLSDFTDSERKELASLLDSMITRGEMTMCSGRVHDKAVELYNQYRQKCRQEELEAQKTMESEALKADVRQHEDRVVLGKLGPIHLTNARTVGAEISA